MWQKFSSTHTQRGAVTAVVWGAPGVQSRPEEGPSVDCDEWDAEGLTRGRRAETPFVQQCDLIFPLPITKTASQDHDSQGDPDVATDEGEPKGTRSKGTLPEEVIYCCGPSLSRNVKRSFGACIQA